MLSFVSLLYVDGAGLFLSWRGLGCFKELLNCAVLNVWVPLVGWKVTLFLLWEFCTLFTGGQLDGLTLDKLDLDRS